MKAVKKPPKDAYMLPESYLGEGVDSLFEKPKSTYALVPLDEIEVVAQIREEFEDEENPLSDLEDSIREHGVLEPVLLRPNPVSRGYQLVCGERRYRAAMNIGLLTIPATIQEMDDAKVRLVQLAENIHRKNLTQFEIAKGLKKDYDDLGLGGVCQKHHKNSAWVYKWLSLLSLPEHAKRLVTENISADIDVIYDINVIEKKNPEEAKALVENIKATKGEKSARKQVKEVRDRLSPKPELALPSILADSKFSATPGLSFLLDNVYIKICDDNISLDKVISDLEGDHKADINIFLQSFFDLGKKQKTRIPLIVCQGLRSGFFSVSDGGSLALAAFLCGATGKGKFNIMTVLGSLVN